MTAVYSKPYLTIPQQIALLQSRGLHISNHAKAEHYLAKIGYYRLSGYWYILRKRTHSPEGEPIVVDDFAEGASLDDVHDLYVFDKHLRLFLLDVIERIEVALRVDVSLQLGRHDPYAYLKPSFVHARYLAPEEGGTQSCYDEWLGKYRKAFADKREDFVLHFKGKYPTSEMPIWMATELWDFGMLSRYFAALKDEYTIPIANQYGVPSVRVIASWLRGISVVRNISAHHSRLWNRTLHKISYPYDDEVPLLQPMVENVAKNRLFAIACILQYFMKYLSPASLWGDRFIDLIDEHFPASPRILPEMMGMPEGWQSWPLWERAGGNRASKQDAKVVSITEA